MSRDDLISFVIIIFEEVSQSRHSSHPHARFAWSARSMITHTVALTGRKSTEKVLMLHDKPINVAAVPAIVFILLSYARKHHR